MRYEQSSSRQSEMERIYSKTPGTHLAYGLESEIDWLIDDHQSYMTYPDMLWAATQAKRAKLNLAMIGIYVDIVIQIPASFKLVLDSRDNIMSWCITIRCPDQTFLIICMSYPDPDQTPESDHQTIDYEYFSGSWYFENGTNWQSVCYTDSTGINLLDLTMGYCGPGPPANNVVTVGGL